LQFYILHAFIMLSITMILTGCASHDVLYSYRGAPCEQKTFTTTTETILLQQNSSYSSIIQYGVSKYYIQEYQRYRKERRINFIEPIEQNYRYIKEIKLYPVGSQFQIQNIYSYYSDTFEGYYWFHYYLVRSLDDNQTMWLNAENINTEKCTMRTNINNPSFLDDIKRADYLRQTYEYVLIDAKPYKEEEFSKEEDLFSVSREYQRRYVQDITKKDNSKK